MICEDAKQVIDVPPPISRSNLSDASSPGGGHGIADEEADEEADGERSRQKRPRCPGQAVGEEQRIRRQRAKANRRNAPELAARRCSIVRATERKLSRTFDEIQRPRVHR